MPLISLFRLLATILAPVALVACSDTPEVKEPDATTPQPSAEPTKPLQIEPSEIEVAPVSEKTYIGPLQDAYERIDPTKDGWESEAFSSAANEQLILLKKIFLHPSDEHSHKKLGELIAADFSAQAILPPDLKATFESRSYEVEQSSSTTPEPPSLKSAKELLAEISSLSPGEPAKVKFKIFRVEPSSEQNVWTSILVSLDSLTSAGHTQVNATWRCLWQQDKDDAPPILQSLMVENFERVTQLNAEQPQFADATASILDSAESYAGQFLTHTDHWRARLPRDLGLDAVANHGIAIADVNGDELDDIYVCQQGGLPNRLFLQNSDGTLTDHTQTSGTGWLDYCASVLFIDLDNDRDRDLIISQDMRMLVMSNDGTGKFTLEFGSSTKAQSFSIAAADYDNDGLVDFYICGYNPTTSNSRSGAMGEPLPFHDANNGGPSTLWRNNGNFIFEDVTDFTGIGKNNTRFSFAATWEDYDNDGDQDLYVANDYGRNCLYRNDGGKFEEIAEKLGLEDTSSGMSVSCGDFNNDGHMDLYNSNMFSSAGNRITYQGQFKEGISEKIRKEFQQIAFGNSLFQSTGDGGFKNVTSTAGVQMGRWAWGSRFIDFNNDGLEDILVANGFISTEDTGDL